MPRKEFLKNVKRIVVKIGSSSITTDDGDISQEKVLLFVKDVSTLIKRGYEVVIVSSGSISAGAGRLQKDRRKLSIPDKQALAAVGQTILMNQYQKLFLNEGFEIGQILLTEDDVKNRRRFLNARNTFNSLLHMSVVPIVNENDSVVIKEIKVGDNDTLSSHVAHIVEADLLILLSDIDGFYNDLNDPEPIDHVEEITQDVLKSAGGSGSVHGTGGMITKLKAAEMIIKAGEMMIIALAEKKGILSEILDGKKIGTLFYNNSNNSLRGRKRWIEFNMKTMGAIKVDSGAKRALIDTKKSLLAIGITGYVGNFNPGDAVNIVDENDEKIGKGIVNYSDNELKQIKGKKTTEIKELLENTFYDEVINRDNMIIY